MIQARAQTIRDRYYAGDCSREVAFQCLSALVCEFLETKTGSPDLRRLCAAAIVLEFMEPAV